MLQWQSELSDSLLIWLDRKSNGDLILAWSNLGALVEGQLKLFLSVYRDDYYNGDNQIIKRKKNQSSKIVSPDEVQLEQLRQFFIKEQIWTEGFNWDSYIEFVQQRRNAIHAFQHREIGTFEEWKEALHFHLCFVRDLGASLPYPDEGFGGLHEV